MAASAASAQTLNTIKSRGVLNCGANGTLAGFGLPDAQGRWTGLDVDFCRAHRRRDLQRPDQGQFVPLTAKDRFTALQSGEVDVLSRNTTWTSSRDTSLGLNFTGVNYYDGQGFMVRKALKVNSALELNDAAVCVQQGTTTELNLADYFRANNMKLKTGRRSRPPTRRSRPMTPAAATPTPPTPRASTASGCGSPTPTTTSSCRRSSPRSRSARGAPRRRPVVRHRRWTHLRDGQRRGARRHQGQCRRADEVGQSGRSSACSAPKASTARRSA